MTSPQEALAAALQERREGARWHDFPDPRRDEVFGGSEHMRRDAFEEGWHAAIAAIVPEDAVAIGHIDGAHNHNAEPVCAICGVGLRTWPQHAASRFDMNPRGLSQRELLDLFDRCEAHPGIRAAIREVLTGEARAVPETSGLREHLDALRTPEGPDDYCMACGELWPCPTAAADE